MDLFTVLPGGVSNGAIFPMLLLLDEDARREFATPPGGRSRHLRCYFPLFALFFLLESYLVTTRLVSKVAIFLCCEFFEDSSA